MTHDGSASALARPSPLVDLHSHVLPYVDDGARDHDEAVEMLRIAAQDGTQIIAATPHAADCQPQQIVEGVRQLNGLAAAEGLAITVVTGSEVQLAADLIDRYHNKQLVTLNGTSYLLLELPLQGEWSRFLRGVIYDLQVADALPILAHAERYPVIQAHPRLLSDLVTTGVLIQVNADSLLGRQGKSARKSAELLIRSHLAHIIASDAHDVTNRPPRLRAAMERAAVIAGHDYADWLRETSLAVVQGTPVILPESLLPEHGMWFGRLITRLTRP